MNYYVLGPRLLVMHQLGRCGCHLCGRTGYSSSSPTVLASDDATLPSSPTGAHLEGIPLANLVAWVSI
jgi:hypothetical protein